MFDLRSLSARVPSDVADLFAMVSSQMDLTSVALTKRREDMLKVRDQLAGGDAAIQEKYHPPPFGLSRPQQAFVQQVLRRSHVNLVEPALDRLVNSIHSGTIRRRVGDGATERMAVVAEAIRSRAHAGAMRRLCENAFAYGTGYLVPLIGDEGVRYWLPDPIGTVLVVDPNDIDDVLAIIEVRRGWGVATAVADDKQWGPVSVRYVTKRYRGLVTTDGRGDAVEEHGFVDTVPAVIARGRDMRHHGEVYGRSLVVGVADATIRVTENEVQLELLRSKQTEGLFVIQGEPTKTSADEQGSDERPTIPNKYFQFPRDGGSVAYVTPESRLEDVIAVTRRFCEDAAIASGLPLDTFLPSLIAGVDASATAARIRAFPLQQRMANLVNEWEHAEEQAILMVAGVIIADETPAFPLTPRALREVVRPEVTKRPSLPEAEAETLSNWQQRTANFFAPVEDAIEFYSDHLGDEAKAALAAAWRAKNDPTRKNGAADELAKFRRDIAKALYQGATTKEVMANLTNLAELVQDVGLPREASYTEPFLPVVAPSGPLVSGDLIRDPQGDVVGAAVTAAPVSTPGDVPGESNQRRNDAAGETQA